MKEIIRIENKNLRIEDADGDTLISVGGSLILSLSEQAAVEISRTLTSIIALKVRQGRMPNPAFA